MSKNTKKINLAAPSKEEQAQLAAMPDQERRALIDTEILKGFEGTPRKVSPDDIKAQALKQLVVNG